MDDVLPALRQALAEPASPGGTDHSDPSSLAPLATAIMLASLDVLSLPDEVLKQVALVLGEKENLGLLDNFAEISDELLAISRKLV